jgi:lysozyme
MSASAVDLVFVRLGREEGERLKAYDDATGLEVHAPKGNLSWGRGFNLEECGSKGLFDVMERYLIGLCETAIRGYPWYKNAGPVRQSVFLDMAYNGGVEGLLHFPHMLSAAARGNWVAAAAECKVEDPRLDASRYAPLRALLLQGDSQ